MLQVTVERKPQPLPVLLDPKFRMVPRHGIKAVSYPEGVTVLKDEKGVDFLDGGFKYIPPLG